MVEKPETNDASKEPDGGHPAMPSGTPLEGEVDDRPRENITIKEALALYRKTPWSDADLARKSGMGRISVSRYWKGDLPHDGMAWRGITGVLERALGHVRIVVSK